MALFFNEDLIVVVTQAVTPDLLISFPMPGNYDYIKSMSNQFFCKRIRPVGRHISARVIIISKQ